MPIAEPRSGSSSAPELPMMRTADVEMKESEQKMTQDDESMEVMKNIDFTDNIFHGIAKGIFTLLFLEYDSILKHFFIRFFFVFLFF